MVDISSEISITCNPENTVMLRREERWKLGFWRVGQYKKNVVEHSQDIQSQIYICNPQILLYVIFLISFDFIRISPTALSGLRTRHSYARGIGSNRYTI